MREDRTRHEVREDAKCVGARPASGHGFNEAVGPQCGPPFRVEITNALPRV
jgi:hypothetical protein